MRELRERVLDRALGLRLLRARPRGGGLLPAQPQRRVPGRQDVRAARDQRRARCTSRCAATSSRSTATSHARLRALVHAVLHAEGGRPLPARDARVARGSCSSRSPARGRCDFVTAVRKPYPAQMIATVVGAPLEDCGAPARALQPAAEPVRRDRRDDPARGARAGGASSSTQYVAGAVEAAPRRPARRPRLGADRGRERGRQAQRRGVRAPGARRDERRRRHDAEPARTRRSACSPTIPTSGGCSARTRRWRRAAAEEVLRFEPVAPVHHARAARGRRVPRRRVPRGHGRVRLRLERQPRGRPATSDPSSFDITADRGLGEVAHLRRRPALLPGREPRARGAAGGPRLPRAAACRGWRSTASRVYGTITGLYGMESLPDPLGSG